MSVSAPITGYDTDNFYAFDPTVNVLLPVTDIGPVIDHQAYERITRLIQFGLKDLSVWTPSKNLDPSTLIIPPTIFTNVPSSHPLAKTEIFGPVLCIHPPFDTFEEAMQNLNSVSHSTGYGLASGCFTSSTQTAESFGRETESGMVWINCWNECDPSVPFGGFGKSGIGKELGEEGYLAFTRLKSITSAL